MRRYRVLATVAVLGLLACEDDKTQAVSPTAVESPAAESALNPTGGPNMAKALNSQIASVCKSYRKGAAQAKKDLIKSPNDEELKAAVADYKALIDDACN
jgi:hypothetical protein